MGTQDTQSTTTEDPRFTEIKKEQVYGVYYQDKLIYIGKTRNPLSRRLDYHRNLAPDGNSDFYRFIQNEVDDPRSDLSIEALDYFSEDTAVKEEDTLNEMSGSGSERKYEGYDWTSEELDILEKSTLREASEQTGASYNQCRKAKLKLGWLEERRFEEWTQEEIDMLGTMTDKDLAEQIDRTAAAISQKRQEMGIDGYRSRPLSREDVLQICVTYHIEDTTHGEIADEYPVSSGTIGRVIRGKSYTDIERPDLELLDRMLEELIGTALDLTAIGTLT